MNIYEILDLFNLDYEESNGGWIRIKCPFREFDHKDANDEGNFVFGIHEEKNAAHCFVCDHNSTLGFFFSFLALLQKKRDLYDIAQKFFYSGCEDRKIQSFLKHAYARFEAERENNKLLDLQFKWFTKLLPSSTTVHYLMDRGVSKEDSMYLIDAMNLKFDHAESRFLIPHYSFETQKFLGVEGRSILKNPSVKTKHYVGSKISDSFLHVYQKERPIAFILVEGPFDLIKIHLMVRKYNYPYQVLGLSGSSVTKKMTAILDREYLPVFILTDNDTAGVKAANKLDHVLTKRVPLVAKLTVPESKNDPDECTEQELQDLLELMNSKLGIPAIDCKRKDK